MFNVHCLANVEQPIFSDIGGGAAVETLQFSVKCVDFGQNQNDTPIKMVICVDLN